MKKLTMIFLGFLFAITCMVSTEPLHAYSRKTSIYTPYTPKSYTKKAPCAGFGKRSKANGLPKTKIVRGHVKKTNKGYTRVNPYARSK